MTDRTHELNSFTEAISDGPMTAEQCAQRLRLYGLITSTEQLQQTFEFMDAVKAPKLRFPRDPHKHKRMVAHRDYCENCGDVLEHDNDQGCNDFIADATESCKAIDEW